MAPSESGTSKTSWSGETPYPSTHLLLLTSDLCFRVIDLNAVPTSLCFCSQRGDLLVGIGKHVHRIDYKQCEFFRAPHGLAFTDS